MVIITSPIPNFIRDRNIISQATHTGAYGLVCTVLVSFDCHGDGFSVYACVFGEGVPEGTYWGAVPPFFVEGFCGLVG